MLAVNSISTHLFLITVVQCIPADLSFGDISDGHGMEWELGEYYNGMGWRTPTLSPLARLDRLLPLKSRHSHILFPSRGTRKPSRTVIPVGAACPKASLQIMSHAARVVSSASHWTVSIGPSGWAEPRRKWRSVHPHVPITRQIVRGG